MKSTIKFLFILGLTLFFSCNNKNISNPSNTVNSGELLRGSDSNQYTGKIVKYYLEADQKKYEEYYVSGSKSGSYYSWFKNGNIKVYGRYSKNKRVGLWKWYSKDGELQYAFVYKC